MYFLVLAIGIFIGYYFDFLYRKIKKLEQAMKPKKKSPAQRLEEELSKSTLVDMSDPIQLAKFQHDETLRQLNPNLYNDNQDEE